MGNGFKRTFLDTSVLIAAFKATRPLHLKARDLLIDIDRKFLSTSLVELELTQPQYSEEYQEEATFYLQYLRQLVSEKMPITEDIIQEGLDTIRATQASGLDAMHLTCAIKMKADEIITAEEKDKGSPWYREKRVSVVYLGDL